MADEQDTGRKRCFRGHGRRASAGDRAELRALLGEKPPLERHHLIEHLHLIQDAKGHVPARLLVALAEEMKLSLAEVFETVRFYERFDYVDDDASSPPPITIRVCTSLSCMLAGAETLLAELRSLAGPEIRVRAAPCMGGCEAAPFAMIGRRRVKRACAEGLLRLAREGRTAAVLSAAQTIEDYLKEGGYRQLVRVKRGELSFDEVTAALAAARVRGLGGAGFPAAEKWKAVAAREGVKYVVVNADESEPGAFKDRGILETTPHKVLEGALIAAHLLDAQGVWVYLRDEYSHIHTVLAREILLLEELGMVPAGYVRLRRGAGAYICGEETALIESLEGKKGWPRQKPPFVSDVGLFGRPTLVHNVETIAAVPDVLRGAHEGLVRYSVSGRVKNPGVYLAPKGSTARALIEMAGGMEEGHALKAFLPGGASGGILPAKLADLPLDFGSLEPYGASIGARALIVLSEKDDLKEVARNLMAFFARESCGQCTPCRVGCEKALRLLEDEAWDVALLKDLAVVMEEGSICGLGRAAPSAFLSIIRHFPEELA